MIATQQKGSGKVGREVDLKEKKGNQSWEKKVMDWEERL